MGLFIWNLDISLWHKSLLVQKIEIGILNLLHKPVTPHRKVGGLVKYSHTHGPH